MGEKRGVYRVWCRGLRKIHNLEDQGLDRLLKRIFKKWNRDMDWIDRCQDRDRLSTCFGLIVYYQVD